MSSDKAPIGTRADYPHFLAIPTRWMDNDLYGHVNNVVYYSYFDTVVNRYLIDPGGLDIHKGTVVGIVAETQCRFFKSFAYPEVVDAGLRVVMAYTLPVEAVPALQTGLMIVTTLLMQPITTMYYQRSGLWAMVARPYPTAGDES